jgi:hypothetical protein
MNEWRAAYIYGVPGVRAQGQNVIIGAKSEQSKAKQSKATNIVD